MAYITLTGVSHSTAQAIADTHGLSVDYLSRGGYGTVSLTGSKRAVSEVRILATIEGCEYVTDLGSK